MPSRFRTTTERSRRSRLRIGLLVGLAAVAMVACAAPAGPVEPDGTVPGLAALPDADDLMPAGGAGGSEWTPLSSVPNNFDITADFPSPQALGEAYVAELEAGWAGGPVRPTFELDPISEGDASSVLVVTQLGAGDDATVGSQYALVVVRHADGWTLDGLWGRSICRRGVDPATRLCA